MKKIFKVVNLHLLRTSPRATCRTPYTGRLDSPQRTSEWRGIVLRSAQRQKPAWASMPHFSLRSAHEAAARAPGDACHCRDVFSSCPAKESNLVRDGGRETVAEVVSHRWACPAYPHRLAVVPPLRVISLAAYILT